MLTVFKILFINYSMMLCLSHKQISCLCKIINQLSTLKISALKKKKKIGLITVYWAHGPGGRRIFVGYSLHYKLQISLQHKLDNHCTLIDNPIIQLNLVWHKSIIIEHQM